VVRPGVGQLPAAVPAAAGHRQPARCGAPSDAAGRGWQREPDRDPGVLVAVLDPRGRVVPVREQALRLSVPRRDQELMAQIWIDTLSTVYPNGVRAVDGLDLTIADGEFFALLGPSGCGKTTLLRTIAGLEQATSGAVSIGDREVTNVEPGKRNVAM